MILYQIKQQHVLHIPGDYEVKFLDKGDLLIPTQAIDMGIPLSWLRKVSVNTPDIKITHGVIYIDKKDITIVKENL